MHRPHVLPNVLSRDAVTRVLGAMHGVPWLTASLLYGSGLRLMECCQLRVKDVDLDRLEVRVRRGKGARDRVTMLPQSLVGPLAAQRDAARVAMQRRWARDRGHVALSFAPGATPSGTRSPRTCWRRAMTSGPCRSCWGTGT